MIFTLGFSQVKELKSWLAYMLVLFAISHSLVYAYVGWSGGRSIQIVDWVPLVFYGIGIAWIINKNFVFMNPENPGTWLNTTNSLRPLKVENQTKLNNRVVPIGILLFGIGISYPLIDTAIPSFYTVETMQDIVKQLDSPNLGDMLKENDNFEMVYGKVIYPRYFQAGKRMEDDRGGTISDFSYSRIEFFIVGTENTWVALPSTAGEESIPHGKDVIVTGIRQGSEFNEEGLQVSGEYIKADQIYFVDN